MFNPDETLNATARLFTPDNSTRTDDYTVFVAHSVPLYLRPRASKFLDFALFGLGMAIGGSLRIIGEKITQGTFLAGVEKPVFEVPIWEEDIPLTLLGFDYGTRAVVLVPIHGKSITPSNSIKVKNAAASAAESMENRTKLTSNFHVVSIDNPRRKPPPNRNLDVGHMQSLIARTA